MTGVLDCLSLCDHMRCSVSGVVVRYDTVVFRTGRRGSLEIDGFSFMEGESGGVLRMLNTLGNMFIGKSYISILIYMNHLTNVICIRACILISGKLIQT